jgi:hypothetical protein
MTDPTDAKRAATAGDAMSSAGGGGPSSVSLVEEIIAGHAEHGLAHYVHLLEDENDAVVSQGARVIDEIVTHKPELLAPHLDRLIAALLSDRPRNVRCAAAALPVLARVTPAKVAKHLPMLVDQLEGAPLAAKDALLRTFVGLCVASVTYQKRLLDVFGRSLQKADDVSLPQWTELILPALKGEPYAQVRAIVEGRLSDPDLPRPTAQRIADHLGIKLRVPPPRA